MEPNSGSHPEASSGFLQLQLQPPGNGSDGLLATAPTEGLPPATVQPKAVTLPQFQLLAYHNVLQNSRVISKWDDDNTIHDVWGRKVRISEDSSIYGLYRSWVRNGLHEVRKTQPKQTTGFLPKPLPKNNAANKLVELDKEDHASINQLSANNLLQSHIKRAKKVRQRLRAERFQQILRYRFRLAALLPTQPQSQ